MGGRQARFVLIGGQAVILWAQVYAGTIPDLNNYLPFSSGDADFFGVENMARVIAERCGWNFQPPEDPGNIIAGTLSKKTSEGVLEVDVLREIPGVTDSEIIGSLEEVTLPFDIKCRVPSPSVLLKAKIHNLHSFGKLRSDGTPRNDLKHAGMLTLICPHFVAHLAEEVRAGHRTEEAVIHELSYLHSVVSSPVANRVAAKNSIRLKRAMPARLNTSQLPRFAKLYANLRQGISMGL